MRMILRDGALGQDWAPPGGDAVPRRLIAASPDTRRTNEPWLWQLLGLAADDPVSPEGLAPVGAQVVSLTANKRRLDLASDPDSVEARLEPVELRSAIREVQRSQAEVIVLFGLAGKAGIDGERLFGAGDTFVAAGDDEPLRLAVSAVGPGATVAIARITPLDGRALGWVP